MKTKLDMVICGRLIDKALAYVTTFVVAWFLCDHHVIIWTNQSPADILQLLLVQMKFIHLFDLFWLDNKFCVSGLKKEKKES